MSTVVAPVICLTIASVSGTYEFLSSLGSFQDDTVYGAEFMDTGWWTAAKPWVESCAVGSLAEGSSAMVGTGRISISG